MELRQLPFPQEGEFLLGRAKGKAAGEAEFPSSWAGRDPGRWSGGVPWATSSQPSELFQNPAARLSLQELLS